MRSKPLYFFLLTTTVFLSGLRYWRWFQGPVSDEATPVTIRVSRGEPVKAIAKRLNEAGLIRQPQLFTWYLRLKGLDARIQAGTFQFNPAMSTAAIAEALTRGTDDVLLTFPEGLRVEEIAAKLVAALPDQDGTQTKEKWREDFLALAKPHEGFLFPDSYLISRQATPEEVVEMMRSNFNKRVSKDLQEDAQAQGLTLAEVITLASIVEREVKFPKDRPVVAGILLRRYRQGTLLGADATLQYALGFAQDEQTWWRKQLTRDDLELDSPYNTRKFPGLPPTPICNPGLAAIKAVIYPETTDYFYYLSDQEGRMYYAITPEEHQANIAAYL